MSSLKKKSKEDIQNDLIPDEAVNNIDEMRDGNTESPSPEVYVDPPMKVMPTLPRSFKSLVNRPIDITNENRNPQNIITLLGTALGIDDYEKNVASFWFLDFIALQVLRYESVLDSDDLSVMVSWLAGEMKLIEEKKLTREAFFHEMEDIFINCSEKISRGTSLLHWDMMIADNNTEVIHAEEEVIEESKEKRTSQSKILKRRVTSKSTHKRSSSEDRGKFSENSLRKIKPDDVENSINNDKEPTISEIDATGILDVIIEATYNMYGNRFHYTLIVAAFVKPVQLHEYILPYTFRTPRPMKMYEVEKLENKKIEKGDVSAASRRAKETTKKKKDSKKPKKKSKDAETSQTALQSAPPIILTDDEILMKKREFILPLMEANEASIVIATSYREANSQSKNTVGKEN